MPDATVLIRFVVECAIRATVLAAAVGCVLAVLRIRDVSTRLAAWTLVLLGSLLMPALTILLPSTEIPIPVLKPDTSRWEATVDTAVVVSRELATENAQTAPPVQPAKPPIRIPDWRVLAISIWTAIAFAMLAQLAVAIWYGRRLLHSADPVPLDAGAPVFESEAVRVPITLGSFRSAIVLPPNWITWDRAKLEAVLAHESDHVRRRDPLRQLVASVNRAVFWFNPLAWWLHRHIAELAEQASDDAALAATGNEAAYAEILLHFFAAAPRRVQWDAVAMATQGKATKRMERILDSGRKLSSGLTRGVIAAVVIAAAPVLYFAAAATPVWAVVNGQDVPPPPAPPAPDAVPAPAPPPPPAGVIGGVPGGIPGGVISGVPGGVPGGVVAGVPGVHAVPAMPAVPPVPAVHAMMQAPPPAPPEPHMDWGGDSFAIVSPNGHVMGSHVNSDRLRGLAKEGEVLWFRRGGEEYVVRDPALIQRVKNAFQPVQDYGKQMGEKGRMQGDAARKMAEEIKRSMEPNKAEMARLGREMGKVGAEMGRLHDNEAEMQRLEAQMKQLEAEMNAKSKAFDDIGKKFNDENSEFRKWQRQFESDMKVMGKEIERKAKEAEAQVKSVEDEALKSKKAEKLL